MNKEQLIAAKNAAVAAGDYAKAAELDVQIKALDANTPNTPNAPFYASNPALKQAVDTLVNLGNIGGTRSTIAPDGITKGEHKATLGNVVFTKFNGNPTGIRAIVTLDDNGTEVYGSLGRNSVEQIKSATEGQAVTVDVYPLESQDNKLYCRVLL